MTCALLSIDPGAKSGACVLVPLNHSLVFHRVIRTAAQRRSCIEDAQRISCIHNLPLVACGEAWGVGGKWTPKQMIGLGAQWGRWEEALELAGVERVMRMQVHEWRGAIFGRGKRRKREAWKRMAVAWASARYGVTMTDDEAEAVCMGHAALDSAALKKLLKGVTR